MAVQTGTGGVEVKIYITDDITTANVERAHNFYDNCTLYVDNRFPIPMARGPINTAGSNTLAKIMHNIETENARLAQSQLDNLKLKVAFWCTDLFKPVIEKIDNKQFPISIFIDNNVSKHEWLFIKQLSDFGVSFFIVTETAENYEANLFNGKEQKEIFGSSDRMDYRSSSADVVTVQELSSITEVEDILYNPNKDLDAALLGIPENEQEILDFYGKLHKKCIDSTDFALFDGTLGVMSAAESAKIPQLNLRSVEYVVNTLALYLKCDSADSNVLTKALKDRYLAEADNLSIQSIYSKMSKTICKINQLFAENYPKNLVMWRPNSESDLMTLDILSKSKRFNVLILIPDKSKAVDFKYVQTVVFPNSKNITQMPLVDSREQITTVAASVEGRVNDELFDGSTLGMYKPGVINKFETVRFKTTFDEIVLWWNRDLFYRPGYSSDNNSAKIPTLFKVVLGIKNGMDNPKLSMEDQYINYISRLLTDKTTLFRTVESFNESMYLNFGSTSNRLPNLQSGMLIKDGVDTFKTSVSERVPLIKNKKLNIDVIQKSRNYTYGFLSEDKQYAIFKAIEQMLVYDYINYESYGLSYNEYVDTLLNVVLNLPTKILRIIQWCMYYNESPKVVLVSTDERIICIEGIILLVFLSLMAFDTVVFVPTCYNSIENRVNPSFQYDRHIIGEAIYNLNTRGITQMAPLDPDNCGNNSKKTQKKSGFFSKLFGKGE